MRQYFIAIILVSALLLAGCNNTSNQNLQGTDLPNKQNTQVSPVSNTGTNSSQNKSIIVNEQANEEKGIFYLGMSRQDVLSALKSMKIDISNEVEITSHPDAWNFGNKLLFAGGYSFEFDKEYKLYEIRVLNDMPTALGLKLGDLIETMENLYGKNYKANHTDNSASYSYLIGKQYFWVYFEKGKVKMWGIHGTDVDKQTQLQPTIKPDNNKAEQTTDKSNKQHSENNLWLKFSLDNYQHERDLVRSFYGKDIKDIEEGKYGSDKTVKIAIALEDVNNDGKNEIIAILFNRFFVGGTSNGSMEIFNINNSVIDKNVHVAQLYLDYTEIEDQQDIGIDKNSGTSFSDFVVNKKRWSWDGKSYYLVK